MAEQYDWEEDYHGYMLDTTSNVDGDISTGVGRHGKLIRDLEAMSVEERIAFVVSVLAAMHYFDSSALRREGQARRWLRKRNLL